MDNISLSSTDIPLWFNITMGLLYALIGSLIPFGFKLIANIYIRSKSGDITGKWVSYWETKNSDEDSWICEEIEFEKFLGKYKVSVHYNSGGYEYSGKGVFKVKNILYIDYKSDRKSSDSNGIGTLIKNTEGNYMIGNWYGPTSDGFPTSGRWLIIHKDEDPVRISKLHFGAAVSNSLNKFLSKESK